MTSSDAVTGMEEAARLATEADLPVLVALASAARSGVVDARGGDLWIHRHAAGEPLVAYLESSLADEAAAVVVGEIDAVTVGYAVVEREALRDGRLLAVITELYVMTDARGVGVGEQILQEVLVWAREQGCFGIDSLALPGDRATKNFFETFGLKARAIVVHSLLDPDIDQG